MTADEFRARSLAEGFAEPVEVQRDGTYTLGEHAHPFEAFAFITDGEITLEVDGVQARYLSGSTFRLPPGKPHREWAGPQGVRYLSARREPRA